MASSRGGKLLNGALIGGLIGAVVGVLLYIVIRGAAGSALNQQLPTTADDLLRIGLIFGGIGIYMGFLWAWGTKPKTSSAEIDAETERKLREQAAKEAAKKSAG